MFMAFLKLTVNFPDCQTPHSACADMFLTLTQVVDHCGSAEEGADLINVQLEKVIKQVHTVPQQRLSF